MLVDDLQELEVFGDVWVDIFRPSLTDCSHSGSVEVPLH